MIVLYYILYWLVMGVIFNTAAITCFRFPGEEEGENPIFDFCLRDVSIMAFAVAIWPMIVYWIITDPEVR